MRDNIPHAIIDSAPSKRVILAVKAVAENAVARDDVDHAVEDCDRRHLLGWIRVVDFASWKGRWRRSGTVGSGTVGRWMLPRLVSCCGSCRNMMSIAPKDMKAIVHMLAHLLLDVWRLVCKISVNFSLNNM